MGLLVYTISSVNSDTLDFLPICIPLISFCGLRTLARTLSSILSRYGGSEHPCLAPDFSGVDSISLHLI